MVRLYQRLVYLTVPAELIGNLVADRKVTWTPLPTDPLWAGLRVLANEYILTELQRTAEHLRLGAFLERLYPDYPAMFKDVTAAMALACELAMRQLLAASALEFLAAVRAQGVRRLYRGKVLEFHKRVTVTKRDWGATVYADGLRVSIDQAAERYELLARQHQEVERELLRRYEQTGYASYANTIPHLRPVTHAAVLGLIGDPQALDSSRCLTKFAGVDIKENESGQYQGNTPITHRGDPWLRYMAYLAGFVLKTQDPIFRQRYRHLIERKEKPLQKNQAMVAVGCKYLRILWVVCTERVPYERGKAEHGLRTPQGDD